MDEILDDSGVVTVLQAHMRSRCLPGLPLLALGDSTVLGQIIQRIRSARFGQKLVVVTSHDADDAPLRDWCAEQGVVCFSGDPDDALDRILRAAEAHNARIVIRCLDSQPLLDPKMLDASARYAIDSGMDYVIVARLPEGVAAEAIPLRTLQRTYEMTNDAQHREAVTSFASSHLEYFERAFLPPPMRLARQDVRLALETEEDYHFLSHLYAEVSPADNGLIRVEDAIAFADYHSQAALPKAA